MISLFPRLRWLLTATVLVGSSLPADAAQRVTFRTDDGAQIVATWYEPSSRPGPAVILVHMSHRSRRDWDDLAERLASEGIGALAIDLRGHGESSSGPSAADDDATYAGMVHDVRAARRYLASRGDVQHTRIGVAGASLGASLAVMGAAAEPGITSIALLSPSLDYRGLRIEAAFRKLAPRPVLLVASNDDYYSVRSSKELHKVGTGTREVITLSQAGHGTTMLVRDPDLVRIVVDWFRRTL